MTVATDSVETVYRGKRQQRVRSWPILPLLLFLLVLFFFPVGQLLAISLTDAKGVLQHRALQTAL
jgi:ABC-type sugar transport system permease subunit